MRDVVEKWFYKVDPVKARGKGKSGVKAGPGRAGFRVNVKMWANTHCVGERYFFARLFARAPKS